MKKTAASERGFSLLEVMVALAVVSVALIALLAVQNRTLLMHGQVKHITRATMLGKELMNLRLAGGDVPRQAVEDTFEQPFENYRWRLEREETPLPGVFKVMVTVSWGAPGDNDSVSLASFMTNQEAGP